MPVVPLEYIEVDDRGVAKLIGTRIKVMHLVAVQRTNGLSVEELRDQYPELSAAQVDAALAYYRANQATVDQQLEDGARLVAEMRAAHPNRWTREEWVARWKARFPDRPVPGSGGEGESPCCPSRSTRTNKSRVRSPEG